MSPPVLHHGAPEEGPPVPASSGAGASPLEIEGFTPPPSATGPVYPHCTNGAAWPGAPMMPTPGMGMMTAPHVVAPPSYHKGYRRRGRATLFVALAALLCSLGAIGAIGYGAVQWRHLLIAEPAAEAEDPDTTQSAALPTEAPDDPATEEPTMAARTHTEVNTRGDIDVVDVGVNIGALEDFLAFQYEVARTKGQTLILMTTSGRCAPCEGVDEALDDPMMQEALQDVRLVRVDVRAFEAELDDLHIPTNIHPAYFLLGADVRPIDGIHGGEWGDDIAKNIAPVLGAFVRGEYSQRKHPGWRPTTTSIAL